MPAPPCADELRKLYDAIMALSTGEKRASISFGDRQVSYSSANVAQLTALYRTFWRTCGADSGLPDISSQAATLRGRPIISNEL